MQKNIIYRIFKEFNSFIYIEILLTIINISSMFALIHNIYFFIILLILNIIGIFFILSYIIRVIKYVKDKIRCEFEKDVEKYNL